MGDTGEVDRDIVILVLRANQVQVARMKEDDPEWFVLIKGENVEAKRFYKKVPRRMLQYLHYHFDVPIHYFYHPDMMPPGGKNQ